MKNKYLIDNDFNLMKIIGKLDDNLDKKLKINSVYIEDDMYYVYRGKEPKKESDLKAGSIYLESETNELILTEYDPDEFKLKILELNKEEYDILNKELKVKKILKDEDSSMDDILEIVKKCKDKITTPNLKNNESYKSNNDYLYFEAGNDDDEVVSLLKEVINNSNITVQEAEQKGADVNLKYGLKKRPTITYSSLEKWMKILDMEVAFTVQEIELEPIDLKDKESSSIVHFTINEDDDPMVKLIKELANKKENLTLAEINAREGNGNGYNVYRGLSIRKALNYSSFLKWGEILGFSLGIKFIEKDK